MMTAQAWISVLARRPWLIIPFATQAVSAIAKRIAAPNDFADFSAEKDIEPILFEHRAGWFIDAVRTEGVEAATERFQRIVGAERLARDPYSCAQRLAHIAYLARLRGGKPLPVDLAGCAHLDAATLANAPEFKRANTWFNNHLLNDYRAALLYLSTFRSDPRCIDMSGMLRLVEGVLERHMSTLFVEGCGPVLNEGSVSYEILILQRLVDLACCSVRTDLANRCRGWIAAEGRQCALVYRKNDIWLLAQIGDVTPDWSETAAEDFLDGFVLQRKTVYSRIWRDELARWAIR